jgi:two-component system phosphate regulon sensor histidine kinase PhoR
VKRNYFLKIFFSYLVIISLSFFVLDQLIRDKIRHQMIETIEKEMLAYAELVDLSLPAEISGRIKQIARISGTRVTLVDADGKVFADSEKEIAGLENHLNRPEIQEARLRGSGRSIRYSQTLMVDTLYVAVPMKAGHRIVGYVRLARPLHDVQQAAETIVRSIFLAMSLIVILSLVIALVVSYRLTAPIRAMEHFTQRLRQGRHPGSLMLRTADETKTLADNINFLVAELQSKIRLANEEKGKLMTALTSINEGVMILNDDERIEFLSPALTNILSGPYEDY